MSLEILGFRLLAPYFGYSLYVFGSLIGLILFALAAGYLFGGWLGDRGLGIKNFFKIILVGGIYVVLISLSYQTVLNVTSELSILRGTLLATFILFFPPMMILASLSPYLIKIIGAYNKDKFGTVAGSIFSIGTLGSLCGTFITAFYLVPTFGAETTLYLDAAVMFLIPVMFLAYQNKTYLIFLTSVFLLFGRGESSVPQSIYETDSIYNHLEIIDYGNFLSLRTEKRSSLIYSFFNKPGSERHFLLYDLFGLPPLIYKVENSLLLGLGAGTLPRLHEKFDQNFAITGVEIDQKIIDLGMRFFELAKAKNLEIVVGDARPFLKKTETKFDLVEIDLFWGGAEIPFYLATQEFFKLTKKHLNEGGILTMNIYDPSPDKMILKPIINTIVLVYRAAYVVPAELGSYFVLASAHDLKYDKLSSASVKDGDLRDAVEYFNGNIERVVYDPNVLVLTDDRSPLEKLTYQAIFKSL